MLKRSGCAMGRPDLATVDEFSVQGWTFKSIFRLDSVALQSQLLYVLRMLSTICSLPRMSKYIPILAPVLIFLG